MLRDCINRNESIVRNSPLYGWYAFAKRARNLSPACCMPPCNQVQRYLLCTILYVRLKGSDIFLRPNIERVAKVNQSTSFFSWTQAESIAWSAGVSIESFAVPARFKERQSNQAR